MENHTRLRSRVAGFIPEKIKAKIRPLYRKLMQGGSHRSSCIAIDSFGGFEVAYRKGTADESVIEHSFDNDIFFSGVPEYQPAAGHTIVDIGAHIGTFSLLSSAKVGCGKVYAIEASRESFNLLRINVALNKLDNISIHHLAIAAADGECVLYHDSENWGHSTVKRLSSSSESTPACTLSSFMEKNNISVCDFMKLNCEGGEFPILLGSKKEVLRRFRIILVLYHCDLWGKNTEHDLIAHLAQCGLSCVVRKAEGQRGWIIATRNEQES